jgi:hypothetical protein
VGKLVVLQEDFQPASASADGWRKMPATGHEAYYSVQGDTASVVVKQAAGPWVDVQAPTALGWTPAQLVKFGLGVTVLSTAKEGQG